MGRQDTIRKNVANYFRARYEQQTDIKSTAALFNAKCFFNAVEFAKNQKVDCDIYECVIIENNWPSLHYIVMKNGDYHEVTLGHRAEQIEYYILRRISKTDWSRIDIEFDRALESWLKQFTTFIDRFVLRIKRVL